VLGKPIEHEYTLFDLLRRPEVSHAALAALPFDGRGDGDGPDPSVAEQVEIEAKYQGYILRQSEEVARNRANEETLLPEDLDYARLGGLSAEIRQKLAKHRPQTIAQASRIQGVTPAAISILLVHLKRAAFAASRGGA
jgi:tRNA uridine 5-carboxymethylaminomethyl modification enzyme